MSRIKRHFIAEFKTKIILEVIEGRRTINKISSEYSIQPNLIRNWKKEFLEKAALVFDDKREDNAREKLEQERKEKEAYAKKGRPAHDAGGLVEKNLRNALDPTGKLSLLKSLMTSEELPLNTGARLLGINRTSIYYTSKPVFSEELKAKAIIDKLHTEHPI